MHAQWNGDSLPELLTGSLRSVGAVAEPGGENVFGDEDRQISGAQERNATGDVGRVHVLLDEVWSGSDTSLLW